MAAISVSAQFPKVVITDTELDLSPANWEWKECLTFLVTKLNDLRFSSKPYKWMRYATGIVVGARGELCTEPDLLNPVPIDYDAGLSATSINLYYHTTDQEKRHMFPIDPVLANTRIRTASGTTSRQADFRNEVEERDESCVVTGETSEFCHAAHLLPHSKGNTVQYETPVRHYPCLQILLMIVYRDFLHKPTSRLQWR
jgi:hypothetical protein